MLTKKNKVLVTGGAGFIGSNFVKLLLNQGDYEIVVYDNLSTGKLENIQQFIDSNKINYENMDITEVSIIKKIREQKFDYIYNFACPASPKFYLSNPIATWKSSVYGINNLLESIIGIKTKLFHSSTSEVYGDPLIPCQTETYWGNVNPIGVRSCYDEGKRAAESLIFDYIRLFDVDVRVARIFNTYGPNMAENDGRVVSNFIMQALKNEDITIYGNGKQTRSFCYVDDTIQCIYKLMMHPEKIKTPVNIGNPNEMDISTVAKYIKNTLKSDSIIINQEAMSDDPKIRRPDITKAKELLNWEPQISFYNGVEKTIKYFENRVNSYEK